jgi:uncharacterized protein
VTADRFGAPFVFNVSGLLADPMGATREHDVAGAIIALEDGLRLADPIEGHIRLIRTNRGLFVTGRLTTSLEGECSRCLRAVVTPVDLTIEEEALPTIDLANGTPAATDADPDALRLSDNHELNLGEAIAAEISLAEPIAPLCRPDGPGLCQVCGAPLEAGDHAHPEGDIDPRLAALRAFRPIDGDG